MITGDHKNWRRRETGKLHIAGAGERCPFGFDPTFYPHRLHEPQKVKKPKRIFVVSAGDLWGEWIPHVWIVEVLKVVKKCPQHTFQLLTKNPRRYLDFELPQNSWAGATVTCDEDYERAKIMKKVKAPVRFLSIEPLLGEVGFDLRGLDWLIIGAMTGKNPLRPKRQWIERILPEAKRLGIPVFLKNNLRPYYPFSIQQFPL